MTEQMKTKLQRIGTYFFAVMLLAVGLLCFAVNVSEFFEHSFVYVSSGTGGFRPVLNYDSLGQVILGLALVALAIIAFIRTKRKDPVQLAASCSWPHWFMLIVLLFAGSDISVQDGFPIRQPFQYCVFALFILRWAIATIRKEKNRLWVFYCALYMLLLFAVGFAASCFRP